MHLMPEGGTIRGPASKVHCSRLGNLHDNNALDDGLSVEKRIGNLHIKGMSCLNYMVTGRIGSSPCVPHSPWYTETLNPTTGSTLLFLHVQDGMEKTVLVKAARLESTGWQNYSKS